MEVHDDVASCFAANFAFKPGLKAQIWKLLLANKGVRENRVNAVTAWLVTCNEGCVNITKVSNIESSSVLFDAIFKLNRLCLQVQVVFV